MSTPRAFDDFPEELRVPFGPYMAVVDRLHDGDTLLVRASTGLDEYPVVWIRLVTEDGEGVYAPELSQPGGRECLDYANGLMGYETPCRVATKITPKSHAEAKSFVRYIGSVEFEGGRDLGAEVKRFVEEHGFGRGSG